MENTTIENFSLLQTINISSTNLRNWNFEKPWRFQKMLNFRQRTKIFETYNNMIEFLRTYCRIRKDWSSTRNSESLKCFSHRRFSSQCRLWWEIWVYGFTDLEEFCFGRILREIRKQLILGENQICPKKLGSRSLMYPKLLPYFSLHLMLCFSFSILHFYSHFSIPIMPL